MNPTGIMAVALMVMLSAATGWAVVTRHHDSRTTHQQCSAPGTRALFTVAIEE